MPRARAAAAPQGLPDHHDETSFLAAFHTGIGRELAAIVVERDRLEREATAADQVDLVVANHLRNAADHLDDREDALLGALSAFPSTTLAGAAIQLFTAIRFFDRISLFTDPDPADERAMRRLLYSAGNVVADAANLDRAASGITAIVGTTGDPWRDAHEVAAELKGLVRPR